MSKEIDLNEYAEYLSQLELEIKNLKARYKAEDLSAKEFKELEEKKEIFKKLEKDYFEKLADQKLNDDYDNIDSEIKEKYDDLKKRNLKLVGYYKYFNNIEEKYNELTKNGKLKKSYERLNKINIKDKPIKKITGKKIARVEMCNCKFTALTDIKFSKSKIVKTIKCKDKFCPICQKIKSTKDGLSIQTMYDYVKDTTNYKYLFLTLTAPNILGEELKKELEDYVKAFKRFLLLKDIQKINKGYISKLEITYNLEKNNYHPHYHLLMAVPSYYFDNSKYYINHSKWLSLWQKAKRDITITQVYVEKVKNKNNSGISSEVQELAKYIGKDSDFLIDLKVFETFYNETYKKRFYKYGGIFKDAMKKFKAGELEKYKKIDVEEWDFIINYSYRVQEGYEKKSLRKLTEQEKLEIAMNEIKNLHIEFED